MIKAEDILLYITGHAPDELKQKIHAWLQESPANKAEFDLLSNLWNQSASLKEVKILDTKKAWNNIEHLIVEDDLTESIQPEQIHKASKIMSGNSSKTVGIVLLLIILILLAGLGIMLFR